MLDSGPDRSEIRNAIQFLARPDVFEPISSASMKKRVRNGLSDLIGGPAGDTAAAIDRDFVKIRGTLASMVDGPFNYWTPGVEERWNADPRPSDSSSPQATDPNEPRQRRYWLFSPAPEPRIGPGAMRRVS
ncbi:hypothetical protein [Tessaracoccus coleopterorum]|uniref:hypothetical protein n=1 Tax=Tessaracoccus coleopterorum TaxID=2714950 RepID=UPI0018D3264B|nr:hypothetical protein [Tessaracoccus coleopterorum]